MKNLILLLFVTALLALSVPAQRRVTVQFPRGTRSSTVHGSVSGYNYIDYVLGARGDQTLSPRLNSASSYASFVILDPRMQNVDGATEQREWSGELPSDGKYTLRVLLPRSAARRSTTASFSLTVAIR